MVQHDGEPCPRCGRIKQGHYAPVAELVRHKISMALCALCQFDDYAAASYTRSVMSRRI